MDVRGYSYFTQRRPDGKRWVATVTEFPELRAESRIHNRALNKLQDEVSATITRRRATGEPVPAPPRELFDMDRFIRKLGGD